MIFYWFIICALVAIAAALVMWIFQCERFVPLQHVLTWSIAGALLFGIFSAAFAYGMRDELVTLQNEYNDLMVYYDIVNNSTDEVVRYDYYTDVLDYNERCHRLQEDNKSFWIGCFMTDEEIETLPVIDFYLRQDVYDTSPGEG
jgi:glucan phosphoethanolaminetransferase (alkaline phosphatase superfamily)